jgi:proteasome accessory factor A
VLTNGARLYVDHAHPEYSSPEVTSPRDAVRWDRAGDEIMREAMRAAGSPEIVVYKNNVDGKGASYGTHENYLVRRSVPFHELAHRLTPFLVTRPLVCGAGRVGLGQRSEDPGFQISQRADYVENDIGSRPPSTGLS